VGKAVEFDEIWSGDLRQEFWGESNVGMHISIITRTLNSGSVSILPKNNSFSKN
jgi:hypothetical protein